MPELEQIAGMHIDAIGAAVYLRHPQIHKIDQLVRQAGFLNERRYTPPKALKPAGEALA